MGQGPPGPQGPAGAPGRVNGARLGYDAASNTMTIDADALSVVGADGRLVLRCDADGCRVTGALSAGRPGLRAAAGPRPATDYALTVDQTGARFTVPVAVSATGGVWEGDRRAVLVGDPVYVRPANAEGRAECGARFLAKYNGTCVAGSDPGQVAPTAVVLYRAD